MSFVLPPNLIQLGGGNVTVNADGSISLAPAASTNVTLTSGQLKLPDGTSSAPSLVFSATDTGLHHTSGRVFITSSTTRAAGFDATGTIIGPGLSLSFGNTGFSDADVFLRRDAPNTLAQRNGANAQKQRWYKFYTDVNNGSWGFVDAGVTSAGALTIGITGNGTGASSLTQIILAGVVRFDAHFGAITADTDGSTITFDMSVSDKHAVTLGGNRTLAASNDQTGQVFILVLKQDGTGSRTVTWWSGIRWAGGAAPTLTVTAGKEDAFSFVKRGAGDYMGFVMGQNI